MCTLHEDRPTFWSYLAQFFFERETFRTKFVEEIKTHFFVQYFFLLNIVCLLWDKAEKYSRAGQATDDSMVHAHCITCLIPKATNTYLEYVILTASLPQQWLHESTSKLRYAYIACLVSFDSSFYRPLSPPRSSIGLCVFHPRRKCSASTESALFNAAMT
jgi:hypothetical protein